MALTAKNCFVPELIKVVWIDYGYHAYCMGYRPLFNTRERVFYRNGALYAEYSVDGYSLGRITEEDIEFTDYRISPYNSFDGYDSKETLSYNEFIEALGNICTFENNELKGGFCKYKYNMKLNHIYNLDCIQGLRNISDKTIDFILTDIPYDAVHGIKPGFREFNKGIADKLTFDLDEFLEECYRVSNGSICIFCGKEQFSSIFSYFSSKKGSTRLIVWEKTNPSPVNGEYIYLSGVEMAVWFKKSGCGTFNPFCKNTVFTYSQGKSTYHPTQKNISLFEELILDNTKPGDIVLDPCMGSGTTAIAALNTDRKYIGFELNKEFCDLANGRAAWSLYSNFLSKFIEYISKEE